MLHIMPHQETMSATIKPKYLPQIEQGENDYRSYRPLILPTASGEHGITILLVNDPQSKHFAGTKYYHLVRFVIHDRNLF